jgi:hypothetical protein
MIRVTIEIWPFGSEKEKRLIDGLIIWNTGKGDHNIGEYEWILGTDPTEIATRKSTTVKGHRRNEGALKLLYLCLDKIYGKKGK